MDTPSVPQKHNEVDKRSKAVYRLKSGQQLPCFASPVRRGRVGPGIR